MKMNRIEKWMVNRTSSGNNGIKLAKKLLSYTRLDDGRQFLDIGCGQGNITMFLGSEYDARVTGIDIDEKELEKAIKANTNTGVKFLKQDARELSFEDRTQDLVLAFGVLHHIPDWQRAVGEIGRITKVDGYFVSAELVYPEWLTRIDDRSSFKFGLHTLDTNLLVRLLQDEGFVTVYTSNKKRRLWQEHEAVYQKKYEKAWARV